MDRDKILNQVLRGYQLATCPEGDAPYLEPMCPAHLNMLEATLAVCLQRAEDKGGGPNCSAGDCVMEAGNWARAEAMYALVEAGMFGYPQGVTEQEVAGK